jgi:hypothetical protein
MGPRRTRMVRDGSRGRRVPHCDQHVGSPPSPGVYPG